jgi:hypothetical protein
MNMEWGRTGQVVVILLTLPAGLGLLAHVVVGTAAIWSMIGVRPKLKAVRGLQLC